MRIVECLIGEGACLVFNHSCSVILCLVHILFLPRGWRLNSSSEVCSWRGCIEVLLPENILKQQVQRIPEDSEIKNIWRKNYPFLEYLRSQSLSWVIIGVAAFWTENNGRLSIDWRLKFKIKENLLAHIPTDGKYQMFGSVLKLAFLEKLLFWEEFVSVTISNFVLQPLIFLWPLRRAACFR